jgi:hypothetical protein
MAGIERREAETRELCEWIRETLAAEDDRFEAAKSVTRRLGAQWHGEYATVAVWTPELVADDVLPEAVELEVFTPAEPVDPGVGGEGTADGEGTGGSERTVTFERETVSTDRVDEFTVVAVEGLTPGTREQLGSLYQLRTTERTIRDPLAVSLPFGTFAPAELYDLDRLDEERDDREYFQRLTEDGVEPHVETKTETDSADGDVPRFAPSTSMLEIHPGSATESGTLAGLRRLYEEIGRKRRAGESLSPAEECFLGYDAVQLMPIEPITENPERANYWRPERDDGTLAATADSDAAADADSETVADADTETVEITLEHPDQTNWGYDIVISGFGAVNPAILETGRPDELVDLIATLHTLPEPKTVVFDIALGHAESRATELLPEQYFSGPGMYGQELDYTQPVVRAILLELMRRKLDFGADGVRIDGAQDFTNWDPERGEWHDDAFLAEMNELVQEVAGVQYRPWLIYEDGRPWPRQDWELASTYRELIDQHPHAFQWGPVTFAHNTPALLTFWASKWWRVKELRDRGAHWISGVANHDTLRRGSQLPVPESWEGDPINPYLGDDPHEIYREAYDNPASDLLMHAFLPGVPMDFTHANARAPWAFVRDTDADWNVKVAAEEHNFLRWHVREEDFAAEENFQQLKQLGFRSGEELVAFADALAAAVEVTADENPDWSEAAAMLSGLDTPFGEVTAGDLDDYASAWMDDVAEFCTLSHWLDDVDPERAAFGRALREFRQERPWLRENLGSGDTFEYRHPTEGTVVYYGLRTALDEEEAVLFLANMEGVEVTVTPTDLSLTEEVDPDGWNVALAPPRMQAGADGGPESANLAVRDAAGNAITRVDQELTLANGDAVVFVRFEG